MKIKPSIARRASFKRDNLAWLVVHHFLSPPLLRELLEQTVEVASGSRIKLSSLVSEVVQEGEPALASWAIRLKPRRDRFGQCLQEFVRAIVWQGDALYGNQRDLSPEEGRSIDDLEFSIAIARSDLTTSPGWSQSEVPQSLAGVLTALGLAREAIHDGSAHDIVGSIETCFADHALRSVMSKHVGDLFVDAERWQHAGALYEAAINCAASIAPGVWDDLVATLVPAIRQSMAGVQRALAGPEVAYPTLKEIEEQAQRSGNWAALANVADDLFDAAFAIRDFDQVTDRRVALLSSPNLDIQHHLSRAFEAWQDRKYQDAYRWFWSVLRRQVAIGSVHSARFTKGHYGRCLIEGSHASFDTARNQENIRLGIRNLIEGGNMRSAEHTEWSEGVVAACVDVEMLEFVKDVARSAPSYANQRTSTMLVLFAQWAEKLPVDSAEVVGKLIAETTSIAVEESTSPFSDQNVRGQALKTLLAIARSNPQSRSSSSEDVARAIRHGLADNSPIVMGDALSLADEYASAMQQGTLTDLAERTLLRMKDFPENFSGTIVGIPALRFLYGVYERLHDAEPNGLRTRIAQVLLQMSSGSSSSTAYLSILEYLVPSDAAALADPARVNEVVAVLSTAAMATNRSDASSSMSALLESPAAVGWDGIAAALDGLKQAVASSLDRRPAAAFTDAYQPILALARNAEAIRQAHPSRATWFDEYCQGVLQQLMEMWHRAHDDPLMFRAFAIPVPTEPDRTIVHNWTFASLHLARSFALEQQMRDAIELAARNSSLRNAIEVAIAVEVPFGEMDRQPEREGSEGKAAFYAALGRRVATLVHEADAERQAYTHFLLDACFRLGPRGEDAAVFALALAAGLQVHWTEEARNYRRRLDNDRDLRLSLGPLLGRLLRKDS